MRDTKVMLQGCIWLLVLIAAGCRSRAPDGAPRDSTRTEASRKPTESPPFASFERAPIDSVLDYATSLTYDEDTGVSDAQALAVFKPGGKRCPEGCTYGPVVTIQPEAGAVFLTDEALKGGRVIARFVNEDTLPYEKLNIAPMSVTYYVVVNTGEVQWTGYFVSSDPARGSLSRVPHPIYVGAPHRGRYPRSTARWIWAAEDETVWASCANHCCKTGP